MNLYETLFQHEEEKNQKLDKQWFTADCCLTSVMRYRRSYVSRKDIFKLLKFYADGTYSYEYVYLDSIK